MLSHEAAAEALFEIDCRSHPMAAEESKNVKGRELWLPDEERHIPQLVTQRARELTILLQAVNLQIERFNGLKTVRITPLQAELTQLQIF